MVGPNQPLGAGLPQVPPPHSGSPVVSGDDVLVSAVVDRLVSLLLLDSPTLVEVVSVAVPDVLPEPSPLDPLVSVFMPESAGHPGKNASAPVNRGREPK